MKLGIAALILGSAAAFAPANTGKGASVLSMTATGTETYTFTKSEEIFKEAQEVSFHYLWSEAKKTKFVWSCSRGTEAMAYSGKSRETFRVRDFGRKNLRL
jgi:hypothetical protein